MKKIFILGDSRTGTTTLHKFMKISGFRSVHYFFKESGVQEPAHLDYDRNWARIKDFIDNSGYDSFSDYPIRTFYKELFDQYPDALFILSTRKDVETWRKSMLSFFSKFDMQIDIDSLAKSYTCINDDIRRLALENSSNFCEICIDDPSEENGVRLSEALGIEGTMSLGWENKTDSYDNGLWTSRVTVFNTTSGGALDYVKRVTFPSKAMLSERGWVYLINDSSDFMEFAYGDESWGETLVARARTIIAKRRVSLIAKNSDYLKYVVPEKVTIYPEYLPKVFDGIQRNPNMPATQISQGKIDNYMFLDRVLLDAKPFGQIYFRGDSHVNWFGAYFMYYAIASRFNEVLSRRKLKTVPPVAFAELEPFLAAYGGDLYSQLDSDMRSFFDGAWRPLSLGDKLERTVGLRLSETKRTSRMVEVESEIVDRIPDRQTFRFKNSNDDLPKAVIFRDSTSDFTLDLIAEHFSTSLFIWHKGLVYEDIIDQERPDIVLHIMAERFLVQYENVDVFGRFFSS